MKETRMPPAQSANLVENSDNTIYGVSVINYDVISGLIINVILKNEEMFTIEGWENNTQLFLLLRTW